MNELSIEAFAKINLALDVVDKLPNGYHKVRMIMQTVKIGDEVTISKVPYTGEGQSPIELSGDCGDKVPLNEHNLIYKAARLMQEEYGLKDGLKIHLKKRIPIAAGMAGGSTDAAATLKGINILYDLGVEESRLRELGVRLGADVPYCIMGGTALAEGIGEELTSLAPMPDCHLVVVKPPVNVSTAFVYGQIDSYGVERHPDVDGMINAIKLNDLKGVASRLDNVLEQVTISNCPEIREIKEALLQNGALGSLMSGSGPSVFGIFDDEEKAKKATTYMEEHFASSQVFLTKPYN